MKVTYIANDGFLLSIGNKRIIVDGLFGREKQYDTIEVPPPEVLNKLEKAQAPFDNIDLITASHIHWDHYDAFSTMECLRNNKKALFLSTEQVIDNIKEDLCFDQALEERVLAVPGTIGIKNCFEVNGIGVKALMLKHGSYFIKDETSGEIYDRHEKTQNLGFLFDMGGFTIYHCGDADPLNIAEYEQYELDKEKIDVAFLDSSILLCEDKCKVKKVFQILNPKYIVPMHSYEDERKQLLELKKEYEGEYPSIQVYMKALDCKAFL